MKQTRISVKIFLDAQHDYVQNRIYLTGALIRGPRATISIVHMTPGPPTDEDEEALLLATLNDILAAIPRAAQDSERMPLHLYVFDGYEQKVWLDALERHRDALWTVPAFFELLTASSAFEEGMFAVLATEVRDRRNLGITCPNLYNVAARLGFRWRTDRDNFRAVFRLRVFDDSVRRPDGVWIEKASRFHSHIPLEYAYGA